MNYKDHCIKNRRQLEEGGVELDEKGNVVENFPAFNDIAELRRKMPYKANTRLWNY